MTDILLTICPPFWEKLPPAGLALLSQYLKSRGLSSEIFDFNIGIYKKLDKSFQKQWTLSPDYIQKDFFDYCFSRFNDVFENYFSLLEKSKISFIGFTVLKSNRNFTLALCAMVREKFPRVKFIFGGPEVLAMKTEGYAHFPLADYFVLGEGYLPLAAILSQQDAKNIYEWVEMENEPPIPEYNGFQLGCYPRKNSLPVQFSRGCVHHCAFCSERLLYKSYRVRKPEEVLREIIYHYENNSIRWFTFYDSLLNGNLGYLDSLLNLIIKSKIKISWDAQIGVRNDTPGSIFQKMKESGCINLFTGLESGSDRVLKLMRKAFCVEDAENFFDRLNAAGIQFEVSLIANYPGETEEDFKQTIDFLQQNKDKIKKIAQVSRFRNYPGTSVVIPEDFRENAADEKIERLLNLFDAEKIPYTKSYINNLL